MTQTRPQPLLFSLQNLVVSLAFVNRNHLLIGSNRAENDIEHSFAVAMLCWYIHDTHKLNLNLEKILKYALAHDFVEVYAGDVNTFASPEARKKKVEIEKVAAARLSKEYEEFADLISTLDGYEAKSDEEALFVWTVDKMQALILGDLDDWRPYKQLAISYARFIEKYDELQAVSSPYCKEIFASLMTYCQTTYYDRPQDS